MIGSNIRIVLLAALLGLSGCATLSAQENGMVTAMSPHSASDTVRRLEGEVRKRGLAVVARIDHAAGAAKIGKSLRPTELLIFGNPQAGTPLMECAQAVGIDLPMKALVWVDAQSRVWLAYNDPAWIVRRHGGSDCPAAENVRKALSAIAAATVAP
jgi:uncharacterized protein (DUF302 family)